MSTRPSDGFTIAAEISLVAVTLATTLSFTRLFVDDSYFWPVALAAVASHVVSMTGRRAGWSVGRTAPRSICAAARSAASPCSWPRRSFTGLKLSRSM